MASTKYNLHPVHVRHLQIGNDQAKVGVRNARATVHGKAPVLIPPVTLIES